MRIHALPIGRVVVKQAFLHARPGVRRRLELLLPGAWSDPMPIRAWLIEHEQERILIDMGETAEVKDAPFARHTLTPEDELPLALRAVGLACEDVTTAVVTHLHPDHFHGAVHLTTSVLVNQAEWADAMSFRGRVIQRLTGVSLPGGINFRPVALDDGPFGGFAASRRLTTDGRVLLVSTPGHTRGHTSVLASSRCCEQPVEGTAGACRRRPITEQLDRLIEAHRDAVEFQCELARVEVVWKFAGADADLRLGTQKLQPAPLSGNDGLVDSSRKTVPFNRCGRDQTASGKRTVLQVPQPVVADRQESSAPCRDGGGRVPDLLAKGGPARSHIGHDTEPSPTKSTRLRVQSRNPARPSATQTNGRRLSANNGPRLDPVRLSQKPNKRRAHGVFAATSRNRGDRI